MSNANTPENDQVDPIEEALSAEPPQDPKDAKKKGIPKALKIGGALMIGSLVLLGVAQTLFTQQNASSQVAGKVAVRSGDVNSFQGARATETTTNPEAAVIEQQRQTQQQEAILKDPSKTYVTADPFGATGSNDTTFSNNAPPPTQAASAAGVEAYGTGGPANPTPVTGTAQDPEKDPALLFARSIYAEAVSIPKPAVSPGNYEAPAASNSQALTGGASTSPVNQNGIPQQDADIPAGRIVYATLTSMLNSIVPQTPPRAIIRGGPFNGAILLGQMENVDDRYLVLKFTTMTIGNRTYPISAMAVNPEMQDAGLVDKVRDRTWSRAALQAGVAFVQTFGAAKVQEGTNSTVTNGPTGSTTTSSTAPRTDKQNMIIAAGGAAEALQPTVDAEINKMRSEVIIQPNKEMGILFLQPLYLR